MCFDCGCREWDNCHHDIRHITTLNLDGAVSANEGQLTRDQVASNVRDGLAVWTAGVTKGTDFDAFIRSLDENVIIKAEDERRFLLTVVYSPHRMPLRGADKRTDLASPQVLEDACWKYAMNGLGTGMWHEEGHADEAVCVENTVYRGPDWVLKDAAGNEQVIKSGTWLAGYILSPHAWELYKSGRIGGVSLDGRAGRKRASAEALARVKGDS